MTPGSKVLYHDVRRLDKPPGGVAGVLLRQVDDNAALTAIPDGVRGRLKSGSAGRIDPDDVRSLVGEQHRRQRPRDVLTEIDDSDTVENAGHGHVLLQQKQLSTKTRIDEIALAVAGQLTTSVHLATQYSNYPFATELFPDQPCSRS